MFCTQCGHALENEAKFCANCGVKVQPKSDLNQQGMSGATGSSAGSSKDTAKVARGMIAFGSIGLALLVITMLWSFIPSSPSSSSATTNGTRYERLSSIPTSSSSNNQVQSTSKSMSFESCLQSIQVMANQYGAPTNVIETTIMRTVRFHASDGSVLVTCSKPDQKMVITRSPRL